MITPTEYSEGHSDAMTVHIISLILRREAPKGSSIHKCGEMLSKIVDIHPIDTCNWCDLDGDVAHDIFWEVFRG